MLSLDPSIEPDLLLLPSDVLRLRPLGLMLCVLEGLLLLSMLWTLPWLLFASIASRRKLFLGPSSFISSRTWRFASRGKMISQTLSSVKSAYTNSSMYVNE